jgi:hypothetical protein
MNADPRLVALVEQLSAEVGRRRIAVAELQAAVAERDARITALERELQDLKTRPFMRARSRRSRETPMKPRGRASAIPASIARRPRPSTTSSASRLDRRARPAPPPSSDRWSSGDE